MEVQDHFLKELRDLSEVSVSVSALAVYQWQLLYPCMYVTHL